MAQVSNQISEFLTNLVVVETKVHSLEICPVDHTDDVLKELMEKFYGKPDLDQNKAGLFENVVKEASLSPNTEHFLIVYGSLAD